MGFKVKRGVSKVFSLSFCHVERSETSHVRRVEILRCTQDDKEGCTLIVQFYF